MSICTSKISADISRILNSAFAGDNVRAIEQLPNSARPSPLKKSLVSVGLWSAEILPCALADFAGLDDGGSSIYGRTLEVTAAMQICTSPTATAAECQRIFSIICDSLLFLQEDYNVTRIWCDNIRYEKELGAIVLPCYAKLKLMVTTAQDENGIRNFIIRRVNT